MWKTPYYSLKNIPYKTDFLKNFQSYIYFSKILYTLWIGFIKMRYKKKKICGGHLYDLLKEKENI